MPFRSRLRRFSAPILASAGLLFSVTNFSAARADAPVISTTSPLPAGANSIPYSVTFQATGGTPPYIWSAVQATLPNGLSMSPAGVLSGTTFVNGNYLASVTVLDSLGQSASGIFALSIAKHIYITTTSPLPIATRQVSYRTSFSSASGYSGLSWTSPSLPPGLTFSGATLSGIPTSVGTFSFPVTVTEQHGTSSTTTFSLTVRDVNAAYSGITNQLSVGLQPLNAAIGDLNQDGHPDIAVACLGAPGLTLWMGDGHGGFPVRKDLSAGIAPNSVSIADVNSDGIPDLVAGNQGSGVSVFVGLGGGNFGSPVIYSGAGIGTSSVMADFNHDGRPDVAIAATQGLAVMLGGSGGTFQLNQTSLVSGGLVGLAVGDFDGDGNKDLAAACELGTIQVFPGNPDGTFRAPSAINVGADPYAVATGDFTGDGRQDIVVAHYNHGGVGIVSVVPGRGDGTFATPTSYLTTHNGPTSITPLDFNLDGRLDFATANYEGNAGTTVNLFAGNSAGSEILATPMTGGSNCFRVLSGDFNQDGKPDLVIVNHASASVSVLLNQAPIVGVPSIVSPVALPGAVAGQAYAYGIQASGGLVPYTFALAGGSLPPGIALGADGLLQGSGTVPGNFAFTAALTDALAQTSSKSFTLAVTSAVTPAVFADFLAVPGHGLVTLTWRAFPESAGGYIRVERADGSGGGFLAVSGNLPTSLAASHASFIDRGVKPLLSYRYRIASPAGERWTYSGVQQVAIPAARFSLSTLAPNPASAPLEIQFELEREGALDLSVYDVSGRRVRVLKHGNAAAGPGTARWDGLSREGDRLPAGAYFLRLGSGGRQATRKLLWIPR